MSFLDFTSRFFIVALTSLVLAGCVGGDNNTPPTASAPVTTTVDEGDAILLGQITSTDPDDGATATFSITNGSSAPAGFLFSSDGSYSFDPADASYNHLNVGGSEVLTIPITVTDDLGATDQTQIQITVNGVNDAPVAGSPVTTSVNEGAAAINGLLSATDVDDGSTATFSITSGVAPDGFNLNGDGSYSFDPSHPSYDHLSAGAADVLTIPVTVTDNAAATDATQIQITVNGTNDLPVASAAVSVSVDEDGAIINGLLSASDADDTSTLLFSITSGIAPDGFVLGGDGAYNFDPSHDSYQRLSAGGSDILTIPVTVTDDQGGIGGTQIQITVNGINDPPVAGASVVRVVDEDAASINGQLASTDVDDTSTASFTVTSGIVPDGFVLNLNGSYSFDPSLARYQHLKVGASDILTIPVTVTDDQAATDSTQIQITVNGTNDTPVPSPEVTFNVNTGDAVINGVFGVTDLDDDSTAIFSTSGAGSPPDGFLLTPEGTYSFDPSHATYTALNFGESTVLTIPVTVTDDQSATGSTQIKITITGNNNIPVAADDSYDTFGNTLLEVGVIPSGSISLVVSGSVLDNDSDLDVLDTLTVSLDTAPTSGTVSLNTDGTFSYSPTAGITAITDSFIYRVSDGIASDTATVNVSIAQRIWYVDNRSAGGTGSSDDPFATLSQVELVVADGDTVYIDDGDASSSGLDSGFTLSVPNVSIVGEGEALVINSTTVAAAGLTPTLTNPAGAGITLNGADNTLIIGLNIDGVSGDGLSITDTSGIVVDGITISNSGESAIQGSGADVELALTDVIIDTVDVVDSTVSDDAIFIAATTSASLTMNGGSISGVPGNLGDAIELENADSANPVSMTLDIRGVTFSSIQQDGIKLDNDNGVMDVQIGGSTIAEGNILDVGFRGIQIQTDADPTLNRTNRIFIQRNNITSGNEGIQIRNINDISNLSILDNTLTRSLTGNASDLIDVQVESTSLTQARINRNDISNVGGSDGIRGRVFDLATLTMEALNNSIDGPSEGFDFDVFASGSIFSDTLLYASILNNTLSNITSQAMNARNATDAAEICMDLQGNSAVANYVLDAISGSFLLTAASQAVVFDPAGGIVSDPGTCPTPTF